ncbi:putative AC9 transposase [Bienertia sinuspersici]
MKDKWYAYFTEFPPIYGIATILDLGVKLQGLTNLLTYYYDQLGMIYDVPNYIWVSSSSCGKTSTRFIIIPSSSSSSSPSNVGIDEYLSYQFDDFHIIQWWKNHSSKFPVFARITKDILAIPASTIASESAFSVGR